MKIRKFGGNETTMSDRKVKKLSYETNRSVMIVQYNSPITRHSYLLVILI